MEKQRKLLPYSTTSFYSFEYRDGLPVLACHHDVLQLSGSNGKRRRIPLSAGIQPGHLRKVFKDPSIWTGYATTIGVTVLGTVFGTLFTATTAYPLSKANLPFQKTLNFLILFTMLFSGGMIPGYLLIKNMHLIDNRWSLILPGLISAYNVIIMRSFFSTIPESLEESARLDGANDVTIFAKSFFRFPRPASRPSRCSPQSVTGMITSPAFCISTPRADGLCRRFSATC